MTPTPMLKDSPPLPQQPEAVLGARDYALSRALYRALLADGLRPQASADESVRILGSCEDAIQRLWDYPGSARCVSRWLYREVCGVYPFETRPFVSALIRCAIHRAADAIEASRQLQVRQCSAYTRGGRPCQREARPGSEFCPSHRHLEAVPA